MVEIEKNEKALLKHLLKKEIEEVEKQEEVITPNIPLLDLEEKYDMFLQKLIKKLE